MAKLMLHGSEARAALARGVEKLATAVGGTLGPRGLNAIIARPQGTPIVSRDGVSIAEEIELECRFENLGAQIVREVSKQTADVAGDGDDHGDRAGKRSYSAGRRDSVSRRRRRGGSYRGIGRRRRGNGRGARNTRAALSPDRTSCDPSRQLQGPIKRSAISWPRRWKRSGRTALSRSIKAPRSRM
ncbi:TCP-1/cpn60 chaperonin family protein [Methylocella tundrae]|uniref:TCP-1/cpn60 chaperonin family protein n=1 Tax=Methylocella tundrae TaxID=227605 RepID=UPI003CC80D11